MDEKFSFEEAYKRLETILEQMSGKSISLEDSLALYAEADRLIEMCANKLDHAEKKIQIMIKNREGNIELGENGAPKLCNFDAANE